MIVSTSHQRCFKCLNNRVGLNTEFLNGLNGSQMWNWRRDGWRLGWPSWFQINPVERRKSMTSCELSGFYLTGKSCFSLSLSLSFSLFILSLSLFLSPSFSFSLSSFWSFLFLLFISLSYFSSLLFLFFSCLFVWWTFWFFGFLVIPITRLMLDTRTLTSIVSLRFYHSASISFRFGEFILVSDRIDSLLIDGRWNACRIRLFSGFSRTRLFPSFASIPIEFTAVRFERLQPNNAIQDDGKYQLSRMNMLRQSHGRWKFAVGVLEQLQPISCS